MGHTEREVGKVRVNTTEYQWTHGKTPRGRGNWLIGINGKVYETAWNSTVTEAVKQAAAQAKATGEKFFEVVVLP